MADTIEALKKEIATRQQNGIPINDLQAKLNSMQNTNVANNISSMVGNIYKPTGNYQYAQGSAQGPATASQVLNGGNVNIIPTSNPFSNVFGNAIGNMASNITGNINTKPIQGQAQGVNNVNNTAAPVQDNTQDKINQALEKAKQARIDAAVANLKNRYNQTISDINVKREQLTPTYDAKKLTAQSNSQLQAKNFAEFLANRGLSRSGTSQQAELMRNLGLQSELAGLDKQQQDELNYYQRLQNNATSSLNNDIRAAENDADTMYYDNFLKYMQEQDMLKRQQDFTREQNKISQDLQRQQLLNSQYDLTSQKQKDAIDAFTNSIAGLGTGYNYQGEVNKILNDGDPTNDWKVNYLTQAMNKAKENAFNNAVGLSELTGSIDANLLIDQMTPEQIKSYESLRNQAGGYAAAINSATDPRQQKIIEAFRNRYLQANPDNQYYNTMTTNVMVPTLKGQTTQSALQNDVVQRAGLEITNKINQIKLNNLPEETRIAIDTAKEQLKNGQLQNAYQTIINSNADSKIKSEIANIYANIAQGWKQLDISQQNANSTAGNLALSQAEFNAKKLAGAYDPENYLLDKQLKKDEVSAKRVSNVVNELNKLYVGKTYNYKTGAEEPVIIGNKDDIKRAILSRGISSTNPSGLSESDIKYLYGVYGIPE